MSFAASNNGFYKTPVTKALFGTTLVTSVACQLPFVSTFKASALQRFALTESVSSISLLANLLASKLAFFETKDLLFGFFFLYKFRVFEKRYGSRKYASYLFTIFVLSTTLEYLFLSLLTRNTKFVEINQLTTGPWFLIFALFVNYFRDIPSISNNNMLGVAVSDKLLYYLLGLHTLVTGPEYYVTGLVGLTTGLICRFNLFGVCNWIKVPNFISNCFSTCFGSLFESKPPKENYNGATLEIQRQQQMDELEENLILESQNEFAMESVSPQEIERYVDELVEMGFDRQAASQALQRAGNDLAQAAALLVDN